MKKIKDPALFEKIRKFLTEDMPVLRKKSPNTVEAYRYTLNIYLVFLCEKHSKSLYNITVKDFSQKNILFFLDWLIEERGNKASTPATPVCAPSTRSNLWSAPLPLPPPGIRALSPQGTAAAESDRAGRFERGQRPYAAKRWVLRRTTRCWRSAKHSPNGHSGSLRMSISARWPVFRTFRQFVHSLCAG